jgi:hypothetical protein
MTLLRRLIERRAKPRFSDHALDLLARLKRTPYESESWPELHGELFHAWPGRRPWFWPVVAPPDESLEGVTDKLTIRNHHEARERWHQIEAAFNARERLRRRARRLRAVTVPPT